MVEETPQTAQPAQLIRRVSLVPFHSPYPRAPYAAQKNTPSSTSRTPAGIHSSTDRGQEGAIPLPGLHGVEITALRGRNDPEALLFHERSHRPQQEAQARLGRERAGGENRQSGRSTTELSGFPAPASSHAAQLPPSHATAPQATAYRAPLPLPPGVPLDAGNPSTLQLSTTQPPRRKPQRDSLDSGPKRKKIGNTTFMILVIIIFFTSVLPRIVEALSPTQEPFTDIIPEEEWREVSEEMRSFAEPPVPIPLGRSTEFGTTIPPEQPGSQETPAGVGQRLVIDDVAITVTEIERGETAKRAAWNNPPSGYEYLLVHLEYENPDRLPVEFSPVLVNDANEGLYPEPLVRNTDFRFDVQPNKKGIMVGEVLFLVKSDEFYTLMLHSYDENYPIVFYALP